MFRQLWKSGVLAGLATLCLAAVGCAARAQGGEGDVHAGGTIIIRGRTSDGVSIDVSNLDLNGSKGQFIIMSDNGNGDMLAFSGSLSEMPFGGSLGPFGMAVMGGGLNGGLTLIDPAVSYIHQLIKRSDVRSDLFLDSKQREQLEKVFADDAQAQQQRAAQLRQTLKGGDPAAAVEDRAKKLHELVGGTASDLDKKIAAILTPKQIKRLKELDLQYRGPLAMGIKPVAEKAKLTDTQAPAVTDLLHQYHEAVRKALGVDQKITRTTGPDGNSTSVSVSSSVNISSPDEMKQKLEKAQEDIEKSRRQLGEKALKSLAEPQVSEWKNLIGVKFQFLSQAPTLN